MAVKIAAHTNRIKLMPAVCQLPLRDMRKPTRGGSPRELCSKRDRPNELGGFQGYDGIRQLAAKLEKQAPNGSFRYELVLVDGHFAFLRWSAESPVTRITNGVDSFLIQDGKIVAQSIHYEVHLRHVPLPQQLQQLKSF
jgi:hypothetical protein